MSEGAYVKPDDSTLSDSFKATAFIPAPSLWPARLGQYDEAGSNEVKSYW
jgi:hypothetical protein